MLSPLSAFSLGGSAHSNLEVVRPAGLQLRRADLLGLADPEERSSGGDAGVVEDDVAPSMHSAASATELIPNCHVPVTSGVNVVRNRAENPGGGPERLDRWDRPSTSSGSTSVVIDSVGNARPGRRPRRPSLIQVDGERRDSDGDNARQPFVGRGNRRRG